MKVLVADDTKSMRMLICMTVQQAGHEVIEAEDGAQAIAACKEHNIDLIVMDAEMPEVDGFEATKAIREYMDDDWIPLIFLSVHSEDDYIQKALDNGADVYLRKPINSVELQGQIKALSRIASMRHKLFELNQELHTVNRVLESQAKVDGLTQIANRRTFDERIKIELARCFRNKLSLTLMLCDIDCFKQYNDTYGHIAGDTCLKKVAKTIESKFSRATDLVARYGGEEFVILLPESEEDISFKMANEMLDLIRGLRIPHKASKAKDYITISVGLVTLRGDGSPTPAEVVEKADGALYKAKETGRDQVLKASDMK